MREFLAALQRERVRKSELKSKEKELAKVLITEKIATEHKGFLYLNNGFYAGRVQTNSRGTGFLAREGGLKDIKIAASDMASARSGDLIIAKATGFKQGRDWAKVLIVCEREIAASVVELVRIKGVYFGKCFRTGLVHELAASQRSLAALPRGAVLAVKFAEKLEITEVLGVIDDPAVDELISLRIFEKREEFDEASLLQARANAGALDASMYPERLDLRELPFCTIDPVHAKDFDDAVYYDARARTLWVMIADVSEYVSDFSALDSEAARRGFSVYLPHKSIPMLPRELSEGACSLNPGEDKLAFGFCLRYAESGALEDASLHEAIIRSHRRFSYDEVDEFLLSRPDLGAANFIYALADFAAKLRRKRLKNGFDFDTAELRMQLDGALYKSSYFERSTASHQLIEDCMLEANKAAAAVLCRGFGGGFGAASGDDRFGAASGDGVGGDGDSAGDGGLTPPRGGKIRQRPERPRSSIQSANADALGIFRNHQSPNLLKIQQMFEDLETLGVKFSQGKNLHESILNAQEMAEEMGLREEIDKIIIRSFKKANYGAQNFGHFALGFDKYSHFTSPIRRYSDLILHRLLKAILRSDARLFAYRAANLAEICAAVSALEKDAEKVAADFCARKFARWAAGQIGGKFRAQVLANDSLQLARLEEGALGAKVVFSGRSERIYSRILVEITDVNLHSAQIFARSLGAAPEPLAPASCAPATPPTSPQSTPTAPATPPTTAPSTSPTRKCAKTRRR